MSSTKISQLLTADASSEMDLVANYSGSTKKVNMSSIVDLVKAELGYYKNPLRKCGHCGQWGAVYCECVKCGAPIDPEGQP